ncbi:MAG: efflux RND transporter permease subunit [Bdellovibrionaceae bacterium]|nr:efflux RND transporter permease subunit [Bdellovibrionales bacterium]MCB9086571.1 efflux RND transporter permease subunit [Pseudobdellovibrionaceae bacterium]
MLIKIIDFCSRNRGLTLMLVACAFVAGWISMKEIPIDAIPDLSDSQVIVYSTWNVSPDIIEDQVTYPIVTSLLGVPKVKDIRGLSTFGASYVYVIFEDGTDIYWARSRVLEYLSKITPQLPKSVQTELGPDATGVGWVYQYALKDISGKHSLADLRSFQDWFLRYQIQSVPGVSEVASFGGFEMQYQVQINPESLRAYNIPLSHVSKAINEGNRETGARVIEFSGTEYMVRAKGYARSKQDIENIVIGVNQQGVPIYVKNVSRVVKGPEMRRGVADLDGLGDVVGGIVVMRFGENANRVIEDVKKKIASLSGSLPEGVKIIETYDRSELIRKTVATLTHELAIEMIVVALVIILFLLHLPSAMVPIVTLPTAVVVSFIFMNLMNVSANIMSLGGIAIAIGAMVDAAIVVVENCHKKMEEWRLAGKNEPLVEVLIGAIKEVGPASFYSLLVIAVSFLPIFVLEAQEGRLFKPLAYTKTLAMLVASVLSITLVPALLIIFTKKREVSYGPSWFQRAFNFLAAPNERSEEDHPISKLLFHLYGPAVDWVVEKRRLVVGIAVALIALTVPAFVQLGSEFMPPLNEGTILYMPTTMPGLSVTEAQKLLQQQDKILKSFPEVLTVHGKAGRAGTATDPAPLTMMETVIVLKDQREWRKVDRWYSFLPEFLTFPFQWITPNYMSWDELVGEMNKKMQFPGLTNAWTMPIKGRIDMLTTGIRTPIGIKISGGDLKKIEEIGIKLEGIVGGLSGTRSVFAERVTGGFFFDFNFNREALARHGISIQKAQETLATALGGKNVTTTVEGRERYSVNVRYARAFRQSKEEIRRILLDSPKGYQIPLSEVATIELLNGPGMIRNDNGLLTGYVYVDLNTSDVGTYVKSAKRAVAEQLDLPTGYSLHWSGQYESIARVKEKLKMVLPITLLLIILFIYMNTKSAVKTSIVLLSIPFSAIGAIWLLYLLDYNMSIAVWVGLIALLGVDAETAIFMLLYLDLSYEKKKKAEGIRSFADLSQAIHEGAVKRIRPKMMTVLTTFMALLPIFLASSASSGADVMKRMAAPMVGGILTSFLLELLVYPAIFAIWKEKEIQLILNTKEKQ